MHRRELIQGGSALVATVLTTSGAASARQAAELPEDVQYMQMALDEAAKAAAPFGAVIVKDGQVLASGYNRTGLDRDPTAHGEMVAIRAFLSAHGPDTLKGATLYTSAEPCCMCMGAIIWCGIGRLVYAASCADIQAKFDQIGLTASEVAAKATFAPVEIAGGVLGDKAAALFK